MTARSRFRAEPSYEAMAKAAGWSFSYGQNNTLTWFRHPKVNEWKRAAGDGFACERADGGLDPEYIMAGSAREACEMDGLIP